MQRKLYLFLNYLHSCATYLHSLLIISIDLCSCRWKPPSRVVYSLTNLPPWDICHNFGFFIQELLVFSYKSGIFFCLKKGQYCLACIKFFLLQHSSLQVPLTDLIKAIGYDSSGNQENSDSTRTGVGDSAGKTNRGEATGRRSVLQDGHLMDAGHALLPANYHLRHGCDTRSSFCCAPSVPRLGFPEKLLCVLLQSSFGEDDRNFENYFTFFKAQL